MTLLERVRRGECLADVGIIDMHGHIGRYRFANAELSLASLIGVMDRLGVEQMLLSHILTMSWEMTRGNEEVLAAMRAYPGRLRGYVCLWPSDPSAVQREVETRLAQGFVGVKLHRSTGFLYTDPAYAPAFALAHERRLPVLLHTWGEAESFREVEELAPRYPEASFLLGHAGVLAEARYGEIARAYPNVYLDPTMSRMPRGLWERLVAAVGAEKLVWGTDGSFFSQTPHVGKVAGARISEAEKVQILGGTARRLLARAETCALS
jgi:predicted TIM-barrel fold metal-dependent hydrolase